ncbi:hypothetical protein Tco_0969148 [Tanacetum coccineum]
MFFAAWTLFLPHLSMLLLLLFLYLRVKQSLVLSLGSLLLLLLTTFGWKGMVDCLLLDQWKMSIKSRLLLDQWKIPSYCIVHDGSTRLDLINKRLKIGVRRMMSGYSESMVKKWKKEKTMVVVVVDVEEDRRVYKSFHEENEA